MKSFSLLLILSATLSLSNNVYGGGNQDATGKQAEQTKRNQQQIPSSPANSITVSQSLPERGASANGANHGATDNLKKSDKYALWIAGFQALLALAVAIATWVYVRVTHRMLEEIKQQSVIANNSAKAADVAAQAASRNADALVNSERAWVMANVERNPNQMGSNILICNSSDGRKSTAVFVALTCRNDGSTPAWIIEKRARLAIFTKRLPKEPPPFGIGGIPGELFQVLTEPLSVNGAAEPQKLDLLCEGSVDDSDRLNFLVLYGYIKYRDVFGSPERFTGFGYVVNNDGYLRRIPMYGDFDAYNRYT